MFTSKEHLHTNLGVDREIAAFFVDRKLPEGNAYWRGRYLYVASGTGYLFIPLFFDLVYRLGVDKADLLDGEYVSICERILHSAALHEFQERSFTEHIEFCKSVVEKKMINSAFFADLVDYFSTEELKPFKNLGTF